MMLGQGYGYQPGAVTDDDIADDMFEARAIYQYKWCMIPRQCYATKKSLWLTRAVRGLATWTGPGDPVVEQRWYHRDQALVMMLKGK
jgi:hypothetical protein